MPSHMTAECSAKPQVYPKERGKALGERRGGGSHLKQPEIVPMRKLKGEKWQVCHQQTGQGQSVLH